MQSFKKLFSNNDANHCVLQDESELTLVHLLSQQVRAREQQLNSPAKKEGYGMDVTIVGRLAAMIDGEICKDCCGQVIPDTLLSTFLIPHRCHISQ